MRRIDAQPAFGVGLSALVGFGQSREVLLVETPVSAGAKQSVRLLPLTRHPTLE